MKYIPSLLCIALVAAGMSTAMAASNTNKGANPNGKPFVEIQGQFVEVNEEIGDMQDHIDSIVERVESLEGRVTANENAITGLEAQNVIYDQQIIDLLNTTAANNAEITTALASITTLQSELDILNTDVTTNSEAIATHETKIEELRDYIVTNTEGLLTLETKISNNFEAIEALKDEIVIIQSDLARKQDILAGSCPAGTALTAIDPSGGVTCETVGTGFTKFTKINYTTVAAAYRTRYLNYCHYHGQYYYCHYSYRTTYPEATVTATCPVGSILLGGGYINNYNLHILSSSSTETANHPANSWIVRARTTRFYPTTIYAKAECIKFN